MYGVPLEGLTVRENEMNVVGGVDERLKMNSSCNFEVGRAGAL